MSLEASALTVCTVNGIKIGGLQQRETGTRCARYGEGAANFFFFFFTKNEETNKKIKINEWFVILLNVSRDEGPCEFSVLAETSCKCSAFYAAANEPSLSDLPRNQIKYTCIS